MAFAVQIAKGIFDLVRDDLSLVEQEIAAQNGAAIEPVARDCELSAPGWRKAAAPGAAAAGGRRGWVSRRRAPSGWARWWR